MAQLVVLSYKLHIQIQNLNWCFTVPLTLCLHKKFMQSYKIYVNPLLCPCLLLPTSLLPATDKLAGILKKKGMILWKWKI